MSNNLTSSYTLDLLIKDDKSKDAIRNLEKEMKGIADIAKKSINNALDHCCPTSFQNKEN